MTPTPLSPLLFEWDVFAQMMRWCVLIDKQCNVLCYNNAFTQRFGTPDTGVSLLLHTKAQGRFYTLIRTCQDKQKWIGEEVPMPLFKGEGEVEPVWAALYPLHNDMTLISMHSTRYMRQIELAHMHRIRASTDDRLWLLDSSGRLVWARVESDYQARINQYLGQHVSDLVVAADRGTVASVMAAAHKNPGHVKVITVTAIENMDTVTADISYLPGGIYGGRYYIASRSGLPRAQRIMGRIKEAYQVTSNTDAAERLDVTPSLVSRYRNADEVPEGWLFKCHRDTGVSLDWLYTGIGSKHIW